jgi:peptidoglycan/LPS O-acetylase OafA/YrhL
MVIFSHFGPNMPVNTGRLGVELFFVLSGRLMAEILFVRRAPLRSFFVRRFTRVYPALAAFATIMFLTAQLRNGDPSLYQYLSAVSFTANYSQVVIGRSPVLDHIWSLCIEEHIYILLGSLAFAQRKWSLPVPRTIAILALGAIVWGGVLSLRGFDYYHVYWRSEVRGASILIGALAYLQLRERMPPWLEANPVPLLALALVMNVDGVPGPIKYSCGTVALAVALLSVEQSTGRVKTMLSNHALRTVGLISYSLYLWQQPFYKAGGGVIYLAAAVICAVASYAIIERLMKPNLQLRYQPSVAS